MSIYSTVENVLLRDYEVLRGLSEATIDKIVVDVMEEMEGYEREMCTEPFIYSIAGALITQYIYKGLCDELQET